MENSAPLPSPGGAFERWAARPASDRFAPPDRLVARFPPDVVAPAAALQTAPAPDVMDPFRPPPAPSFDLRSGEIW